MVSTVRLLGMALLLSACATARLGTGGQRWQRVTTEHFTLYTDLDAPSALARAQGFERWLSALRQHGFHVTGELPLRLNVVIFADSRAYFRTGRDHTAGYHVSNVAFEPWVVMPEAQGAQNDEVFRHELTHYLMGLAIHRQPAWFAEGLATYFESAHFEDDGTFAVGSIPTQRALWLIAQGVMPVPALFSPEADRTTPSFYASSWLVVHYLMSEEGERFEAYQDALAQGMGHTAAWQRAFPALSPEVLQTRVRAYFHGEQFPKYVLPVDARPGTAQAHPLTQADEYALQGLLWAGCPRCDPPRREAGVREAMAAALRLDPLQTQAVAWQLLRSGLVNDARLRKAEELATRHPDDWLAWMTLGAVALNGQRLPEVLARHDVVGALRRVAPRSPYPHLIAAYAHASRGEREEALGEAEAARRRGPANAALLEMQVDLLADLGACRELEETLATLASLAHDGNPPPDVAVRRRVARCEARARSSGAAPPALSAPDR